MSSLIRQGRLRDAANGRGGWRSKLYGPTAACPVHRVKFKDGPTGGWIVRRVPAEVAPDDYFDRLERALNDAVVQHASRSTSQPTMGDLAARYVRWLEDQGCKERYINKVAGLLNKWVLASDADLLVQRWSPEDSARWIAAARAADLSPARVEDLGVALSGVRKTGYRLHDGKRWLDRGENPLEGVSYSKRPTMEGAHSSWVPPEQRPLTSQVDSLIAAARDRSRWEWTPTQMGIGAFCGLRLAEQMALRAVDIDLIHHQLHIRSSIAWAVPSKGIPMRLGTTKTGRSRVVPYPGSLHEELLARCRQAFGLPGDATADDVTRVQQAWYAEHLAQHDATVIRSRRARPITEHDLLLFIDDATGLPPTKEKYGEEFRTIRGRSTWPTSIPWLNARHHAAMWWRQISTRGGRPLVEWHLIAAYLGNSEQTCRQHYVRVGDDQLGDMRAVLADL